MTRIWLRRPGLPALEPGNPAISGAVPHQPARASLRDRKSQHEINTRPAVFRGNLGDDLAKDDHEQHPKPRYPSVTARTKNHETDPEIHVFLVHTEEVTGSILLSPTLHFSMRPRLRYPNWTCVMVYQVGANTNSVIAATTAAD